VGIGMAGLRPRVRPRRRPACPSRAALEVVRPVRAAPVCPASHSTVCAAPTSRCCYVPGSLSARCLSAPDTRHRTSPAPSTHTCCRGMTKPRRSPGHAYSAPVEPSACGGNIASRNSSGTSSGLA
jgi:hypothetical protein